MEGFLATSEMRLTLYIFVLFGSTFFCDNLLSFECLRICSLLLAEQIKITRLCFVVYFSNERVRLTDGIIYVRRHT